MLRDAKYVADRSLATALFLALKLGRPLFLEGEAGVGKTEIGKVLSESLGRRLIRLQCYEGLDVSSAVYEWNYAMQMIDIRIAEAAGEQDRSRIEKGIFSERFLIERPLLQALKPDASGNPPILLIDELDRTDEPFEAFLLEVLSDFQVTIPEIGTVAAQKPPIVIITSNRTREIHDAIKRRCFYFWVDYPNAARELEILRTKVPDAAEALSNQVVAFVQHLRNRDLFKLPGVAETIDWTNALIQLDRIDLDPETVNASLGILLKYQDDIEKMQGSEAAGILDEVKAGGGPVAAPRVETRMAETTPGMQLLKRLEGNKLAPNIMHFGRVLRAAGMPVGPGKIIDAAKAVVAVGIGGRSDFYWALHAVFVNRRDQHELFDQAFPRLLERPQAARTDDGHSPSPGRCRRTAGARGTTHAPAAGCAESVGGRP